MDGFYQGAYKGKEYDASVKKVESINNYINDDLQKQLSEIKQETNKKADRIEVPCKLDDLEPNENVIIFNCGDSSI